MENKKTHSIQDQTNSEIRKLIASKGTQRGAYTKNELLYLAQYTGNTKTEDESSDGILWDFYTPDEIVKICWKLAFKYGFVATSESKILEPSCGIGRFLRYAPYYAKKV